MDPIHSLSRESIERLKRMLDDYEHGNRVLNRSRTEQDGLSDAPEVYVALVPNGGVAGTAHDSSGSGTGTGTYQADPGVVNYYDCDIYRIDPSNDILKVQTGLTRRVYNISEGILYGPQFSPIARDKFGRWVFLLPPNVMQTVVITSGVPVANDTIGGVATGNLWYPARIVECYRDGGGIFEWHNRDLVYVIDINARELGDGEKGRASLLGYWDGFRRYLGMPDLWKKGDC